VSTAARLNTHRTDEHEAALAALRQLCRPLTGGDAVEPTFAVVQPNEIPHPADELLVHHEHMTGVLERRYGRPVDLHVLDERLAGDVYTRKIYLTPAGGGPVVEWGIMRLDLRFVSDAVRDEVLARRTPLGAILINHNVHRRVKPRWFLRFPGGGPLLRFFGERGGEPMYGRIGTIYCDEDPAIELLEIVTSAPV
jgi:hypothetical protein